MKPPKLDPAGECSRLIFFHGAVLAGLDAKNPRAVETARYFWNVFPFIKALGELVRAHEGEARDLWQKQLELPMPFGAGPLGRQQVPISEAQLTEWRVMAHNWIGVDEIIWAADEPGPGRIVLVLLDALAALTGKLEEVRKVDAVLREAHQRSEGGT